MEIYRGHSWAPLDGILSIHGGLMECDNVNEPKRVEKGQEGLNDLESLT